MAAQGSRTLKLSLLADVAEFTKGIKVASKDTQSIGDQFTAFGKKAAVAFAAAGAAIGAFAIASVKAAAQDEAGQKKLEETIRNTTDATASQIAGIDKYVTAQSIATATTDDVIRPALSRLLRATGDLTKSQELLTLSQEIAAATGKPLEAVTNAVAKSFEGSNTALTKLGVGIDAATLKTLTFDQTQQLLNKTFDGFIENQSETAAFKFQQLTIAIDETKEQVGAALLPAVTALTEYILTNVVPVIQSFVDGLTGKDGLEQGLTDSEKTAVAWGKRIKGLIETIINFKDELLIVAGILATIFVANKIAAGVTATITLIKLMTSAYVALRNTALAAAIATRFAANPLLGLASAAAIAAAIYGASKIFDNDDAKNNAPSTGAIPFEGGFGKGLKAGVITDSRGLPLYFEDDLAEEPEDRERRIAEFLKRQPSNTIMTPSATVSPVIVSSKFGGQRDISGLSLAQQNAVLRSIELQLETQRLRDAREANTTPPPAITVNVTGAIDAEGTARTIVDTLNNSFYRGTGGANSLQFG